MPILFYDAVEESPASIRKRLLQKLDALRASHATRLKEIVSATDDLVTKHQEQQVKTAFVKLRARLRQFADAHHQLPDQTITVHSQLLAAFNHRHPRTVWASARRNGEWDNLDSYQIVGVAANVDAEARSKQAAVAIDALLDELSKDPDCVAIQSHLQVLKKNVADWKLKSSLKSPTEAKKYSGLSFTRTIRCGTRAKVFGAGEGVSATRWLRRFRNGCPIKATSGFKKL